MSKPIYLLQANFEADLGFKQRETIEYYYYFESYGQAELHIPIFTDKAVRKFKSRWKLDEDNDDFTIEILIKERHLFSGD